MSAQHFLTSMEIDFSDSQFQGLQVAAGWIKDLESSDSRIHKEKVIEKALMAARLGSTNAQSFLFNCYLAYNPFYTYNIKQVPETSGLIDRPNHWPQFWALCEALRTRSLTGNAMRRAVEKCSEDFDSDEWNMVCRRVLIKDLRCGISEKTINKVVGKTDWRIPTFGCQLATDSDSHPNKMHGEVRVEPKLDGVRVLAFVDMHNTVTLYSRNGKVFENFGVIEDVLVKNAHAIKNVLMTGQGVVLDGEIVAESFQALMKQAHRKHNANAGDSVYHIFDFVPINNFLEGHWGGPQAGRFARLSKMQSIIDNSPNLQLVQGITVDLDFSEGHDQLRRYAQDQVAAGYEGVMIKAMGAPYECKRASHWMKWKPTITVDLEVIDVEPGTGRNLGRLGALVCSGSDNGREITVNVGSGFSDSDRDSFWHHHSNGNSIIGQIVEVEADVVTQNKDGTYSLRFPRFVRFRGFDAGEKL